MGHHATIGTRLTPAPRVRVTATNYKTQTQYGQDTHFEGDRKGTPAWSNPVSSIQNEWDDARGAQFASRFARSIVVQGDWTSPKKGVKMLRTQLGYLRVASTGRGRPHAVFLGTEYLGQIDGKRLSSVSGRDLLITQVIAGTLTR